MAHGDLVSFLRFFESEWWLLAFKRFRLCNDKGWIVNALGLIDIVIEHKVAAESPSSFVSRGIILTERASLEIDVLRHSVRVVASSYQTRCLITRFALSDVKQIRLDTTHKFFHRVHIENRSRIPFRATMDKRIVRRWSFTKPWIALRVLYGRSVLLLFVQ